MSDQSAKSALKIFEDDGTSIERERLRTSMMDGAELTSYRYRNLAKTRTPLPPLLCLPDELGRAIDHDHFALALLRMTKRPTFIHSLSMRGRGTSDADGIADTSAVDEAGDLISYCDAHNLHHIDVVVNGRSIYMLLLALVKRPGLARRIVLNDAAPEFDAVAIARETTLNQRGKVPANWDEAVDLLKERKGQAFPAFTDKEWQHAASLCWKDKDGKPTPANDMNLVRFSNAADYDTPQPRLWAEFRLLRNCRTLLVRGENSALVTPPIVEQMKDELIDFQVEIAEGQGHVPMLTVGDLPERINEFLTA